MFTPSAGTRNKGPLISHLIEMTTVRGGVAEKREAVQKAIEGRKFVDDGNSIHAIYRGSSMESTPYLDATTCGTTNTRSRTGGPRCSSSFSR
jgi:hypothetical protein